MSAVENPHYPITDESYWSAYAIWDYLRVESQRKKIANAEAIMVLGCSTNLVGVTAAKLYQQLDQLGKEPLVVCTGGNSRRSAEWPITEATLNQRTLLDLGVPEGQILTDHLATNFGDNIRNSRQLLLRRLGRTPKVVAGVTIDFASRRWRASMQRQWMEVTPAVVPAGIEFDSYLKSPESFSNLVNNLISELQKVRTYPARDFMVGQNPVASDLLKAMEAECVLEELKKSTQSEAKHLK